MLFSIKNIEDLEKLNDAILLQKQVQEVRLQNKLGEQNYHEDIKKFFKPMTDEMKNTSENLTKAITENSINNIKAISDLNEKILELMNDRGMIAPYLTTSLVEVFKKDNKVNFD